VVSGKAGKPENAGEFAAPPVVEIGAVIEIFIGRDRLDFSDVFVRLELKFAGLVVVIAHSEIAAFDQAAESAQTASHLIAVATLPQRFEVDFIRFNRNTVPPAVIPIFEGEPAFIGEPSRASAQISGPGERIEYRANGRPVIVGLLPAAVAKEE